MGWVWVWETEVAEPTVISLLKPDGVCYSVKTITENLVVQVPLNNETNPHYWNLLIASTKFSGCSDQSSLK